MKKYPKAFLNYLDHSLELTTEEINEKTRDEMFNEVLEYEGYGMYAGLTIRNMIKDIYGIDLTHYEEYLDPEKVAEMDGLEEY